jgi:mono/diheme cytochrome c family protein
VRQRRRVWPGAVLAVAAGFAVNAAAQAPANGDGSRGALLYATHCNACHTTQVHWRDHKRVTSPAGLEAEVRRWQAMGGLGWSDDEVADVARYLDAVYYRFPAVTGKQLGGDRAPSAIDSRRSRLIRAAG